MRIDTFTRVTRVKYQKTDSKGKLEVSLFENSARVLDVPSKTNGESERNKIGLSI